MSQRRQTFGGRRRTLGPLSSSAANSRASLGASKRKSLMPMKKRQSLAPRPSLGGRRNRQSMGFRKSTSRRSSVYGKASKIQDPRPIGDKAHTSQNIKTLVAFLTAHQFENQITGKQMTSPSSRDFRQISAFLFNQFDPNFVFDNDNFEDEFKQFLLQLGYPFNISKSSLKSPGSPHTWPSLLAALVWMIELLQYSEVVEADDEKACQDQDLGADESNVKNFYNYLVDAYEQFMDGQDSHSILDEQLNQRYAERSERLQSTIDRVQAQNQRLEKELKDMEKLSTERTADRLEQKRSDLETDVRKFESLIDKLEEHHSALQTKLAEREQEVSDHKDQIAQLDKEKDSLKAQVDAQEFSPLEVQRMTQERILLRNGLERTSRQKEELTKKQWELKQDLDKMQEQIRETAAAFNSKAQDLQLVPSSAKYANGNNYEIKLRLDRLLDTSDDQLVDCDSLVSVDLQDVVKPALLELKEELAEQLRESQHGLREMQRKGQSLATSAAEYSAEVADLKKRFEKMRQKYEEERASDRLEVAQLVDAVTQKDEERKKLDADTKKALDDSVNKLQQIDAEFANLQELQKEEQDALQAEIVQVLEEVTQHKAYVENTLHQLVDTFVAVKKRIQ